MIDRIKKTRRWSFQRFAILSLAAACISLPGCRNQNADPPDDRSPRQQLEDEFAGCPPLLPLDPSKGGWQLAPAAKYTVIGSGDWVMVRASGRDDVTYDVTLATGKMGAVLADAGPTTKPSKKAPASAGAPEVYLYRRPPSSRLSGVQMDFHVCGHLRTGVPLGFVTIHDAGGAHSFAVEPAERPK